jgi:plastocyanin
MRLSRFFILSVVAASLASGQEKPTPQEETPPASKASKGGSIEGQVKARPAKYAQWAVISIKDMKGEFKPPEKPVVIDQKNLTFVPHVLPVLKGTTVNFLNSDNVAHNVFSPDGEKYNLGSWPQGETRSHVFKELGVYTQLCNVHPEMEAFVVVQANPFFAVSDEKGHYEIKDVPVGDFTLVIWSERLKGEETPVKVEAGKGTVINFELKR